MLEQIWDMLPSDLVYPELTQTEREQVAAVEMQAHTQILQAIEAKDRQRVSDLIVTHILNSLRYSAPVLEKNVDRIEELTTV
jgi:DNA-binding FadR family transcriptional regulator